MAGSAAVIAIVALVAVVLKFQSSPSKTDQSSATAWVNVTLSGNNLAFNVSMPGKPEEQSVGVEGTGIKNSLWWLDQGDVVYSVFLRSVEGNVTSTVERAFEVGLNNFENGKRESRRNVELDFAPPFKEHIAMEQRIGIPVWKRVRPTATDLEGRYVMGEMDDYVGEEFPAGVAFQLIYGCDHRGGTLQLVLQVEMLEQRYKRNTTAADADIRKFFDSLEYSRQPLH